MEHAPLSAARQSAQSIRVLPGSGIRRVGNPVRQLRGVRRERRGPVNAARRVEVNRQRQDVDQHKHGRASIGQPGKAADRN